MDDGLRVGQEGLAESSDGVMESRAGCPRWDVEEFGDLNEGQAEVVVQDEDRPPFDRELPERAFQLVAIGKGGAAIRGRWPSHRQDPDVGSPLTGPLRLVVAGMDEDPVDPRLEAVRIPKLRKPAPGEDEGVLQRILGETRVAQDPLGDRIEAVADLMHQDGERLSVSPTGLFDEVSIHVDLTVAATHGRGLPSMTGAPATNVQSRSVPLTRSRPGARA